MPHFPFNISEGRRVLKKLNARMATFGAIDQVPYLWTSARIGRCTDADRFRDDGIEHQAHHKSARSPLLAREIRVLALLGVLVSILCLYL